MPEPTCGTCRHARWRKGKCRDGTVNGDCLYEVESPPPLPVAITRSYWYHDPAGIDRVAIEAHYTGCPTWQGKDGDHA